MALVCRSWFSHFKKNWINYNYLSIFEFKKFGNIQQIKKIFEISRLPHIKKIKQLFQGQKLETFFQKSEIKIKTPNQILNPVQGNLLEQFSIRPKKSGQSLFLTDKNLNELLELSRFSMQHISLGSCHFLTEKSIQKISICKNLKSLYSGQQIIRVNCEKMQQFEKTQDTRMQQSQRRNFYHFIIIKILINPRFFQYQKVGFH
ncbi:hypothetical protein PPERSA_10446 [Pseudocohnilembus persalinus]|uniref:Uncharacterized protein n=1 Tax=Pseudocohnilembus persalinus TaxID=266149 RepID=A0A0V0R0P6_PSEPJ|nr:hypothetical protein PPERSA_10446 [Pseudocohnilembus persalinus]|eukprot:KRX08084.1 hypothetical protein PPERSA_10446 [Pseudocohnilembus persalinus]